MDTVIGMIVFDNYDDLLDSMDDMRHFALISSTEKKIYELARQVDGVIKKYDKGKYLFLLTSESLEHVKEKRFEILNQIRGIDMGNKIPLTISIGIGAGGETLAETMDFAKTALDLSLSRGGDQVIIKDGDSYHFYGGKTSETSRRSGIRARIKANALCSLFENVSDVIIMGHRNADFDCFGAAVGVYKIAASLGVNARILSNSASKSVMVIYDRLTKIPEYSRDVFIDNVGAAALASDKSLLVVVDTHRPSFTEYPPLLGMTNKVVVFDHHRKHTEHIQNPVMNYHEPYASSTCELVTEMLSYLKTGIVLQPAEADALLAGITVDTKNFAFKTGARTFEAAAYLRRHGADGVRVKVLFQNDMDAYLDKTLAVNHSEIFMDNIAITTVPPEVHNPSLTTAQTADELLGISGILASFVLCDSPSDQAVLISARSMGDINVQMIMEKLNGGGHQTVAGAQVTGTTIEKVMEILKDAVREYVKNESEVM